MSAPVYRYIQQRLQERKTADNFRVLGSLIGGIDFTSNDYLGLARDKDLATAVERELTSCKELPLGSTGSRLLTGNTAYAMQLEKQIALFHHAEAALLFNSGFDANYGLLSCLPYRGDTVLYDASVHASIHDGMRNSKATSIPFAHNDVADLEVKLKSAKGIKYVVIESYYSMDGDFAPLKLIAALCKQYEAGLIIDEAHATGLFGENGSGYANAEGVEADCLARIYTYGKAMGAHGAAIVGHSALIDFLINYCRPFIFSTAASLHSLVVLSCVYKFLPSLQARRENLLHLVTKFKEKLADLSAGHILPGNGPVQSVVFPGNANIKSLATKLQQQGFDVRPILYPTVPKGTERIRVCLHSFNTTEEVVKLAQAIKSA